MIWDVHVHVAGVERRNGNYLSPRFRRSLACRLFLRRLGLGANALNADDGDEQIARFIVNQSTPVAWIGRCCWHLTRHIGKMERVTRNEH